MATYLVIPRPSSSSQIERLEVITWADGGSLPQTHHQWTNHTKTVEEEKTQDPPLAKHPNSQYLYPTTSLVEVWALHWISNGTNQKPSTPSNVKCGFLCSPLQRGDVPRILVGNTSSDTTYTQKKRMVEGFKGFFMVLFGL